MTATKPTAASVRRVLAGWDKPATDIAQSAAVFAAALEAPCALCGAQANASCRPNSVCRPGAGTAHR